MAFLRPNLAFRKPFVIHDILGQIFWAKLSIVFTVKLLRVGRLFLVPNSALGPSICLTTHSRLYLQFTLSFLCLQMDPLNFVVTFTTLYVVIVVLIIILFERCRSMLIEQRITGRFREEEHSQPLTRIIDTDSTAETHSPEEGSFKLQAQRFYASFVLAHDNDRSTPHVTAHLGEHTLGEDVQANLAQANNYSSVVNIETLDSACSCLDDSFVNKAYPI